MKQNLADTKEPDQTLEQPHLFEYFPAIANRLPWISLGRCPTPVVPIDLPIPYVGREQLWFKRDEFTSNIYGGNKVRKLEWLLADALYQGGQHIITAGAVGSNHVLATAIHARKLGLNLTAVQFSRPLNWHILATKCASERYGTRIFQVPHRCLVPFFVGIKCIKAALFSHHKYHWIPFGGSNPLGTLGYVEAAFELKAQIDAGVLPEPTAIFVAVGTAGTFSGLVLGCRLAGIQSRMVGVRVVSRITCNTIRVRTLANRTLSLLRKTGMTQTLRPIQSKDFTLLHEHFGSGYGIPTKAAVETVAFLERQQLQLETTYTGKAFAGMLSELRTCMALRNKPVLFWNTYCSPYAISSGSQGSDFIE